MPIPNEAEIPAFALIDFDELRGGCQTLAEVQARALKDASETRTPSIIVHVVGYTRIPDAPAELVSLVEGQTGAPGPIQTADTSKVVATNAPPSQQPTPAPVTAQPTHTPLINDAPISSSSSTRVAPKYPNIRGVNFPAFVNIVAKDGPDGPPTKDQVEAAEGEIKRLGGSLTKTVRSWTGLEADQINSAAMSSVVTILKGWVK